jgi:hypothetical protein
VFSLLGKVQTLSRLYIIVYIICKKCEMQCQRPCCAQCARPSYSGATWPGHGSIPPRFRVTLPAVNSSGWSPLSGLVARGWTKYPEASQVIYIYYIFIYLFIHIYNTNAWNCLEFPGSRSTMYRQDPTISSGFRGQDDAWYVVRLGLSFLTSPLPGRRCPKDSFPSNPTTENTNNCRKNT